MSTVLIGSGGISTATRQNLRSHKFSGNPFLTSYFFLICSHIHRDTRVANTMYTLKKI